MWETGLIVLVSVGCCVLLMHLFSDIIQDMVGSRLADVFTMENMYVPVLTVLLLFLVAGVLPGYMYARIPVTQVFPPLYGKQAFVEAGTAVCAVCGCCLYIGHAVYYRFAVPRFDEA